jgi:hypothetical protein
MRIAIDDDVDVGTTLSDRLIFMRLRAQFEYDVRVVCVVSDEFPPSFV